MFYNHSQKWVNWYSTTLCQLDYSVTFQEYSVNQWLNGGVPASKLIVGLPLYGRTYILVDPEDHGLGARINDSGTAGPYTREPGFLAYYEVFH